MPHAAAASMSRAASCPSALLSSPLLSSPLRSLQTIQCCYFSENWGVLADLLAEFNGLFFNYYPTVSKKDLSFTSRLSISNTVYILLYYIHKIHQTSVGTLSSPMVSFKWTSRESERRRWNLKISYWGRKNSLKSVHECKQTMKQTSGSD